MALKDRPRNEQKAFWAKFKERFSEKYVPRTKEERDAHIRGAVADLLTPPTKSYRGMIGIFGERVRKKLDEATAFQAKITSARKEFEEMRQKHEEKIKPKPTKIEAQKEERKKIDTLRRVGELEAKVSTLKAKGVEVKNTEEYLSEIKKSPLLATESGFKLIEESIKTDEALSEGMDSLKANLAKRVDRRLESRGLKT